MTCMKNRKHYVLAIYCLVFYTVWAFYEFVLGSKLDVLIPSDFLRKLIGDGIIKNLVWTLPAIWLISRFSSDVSVGLKEMFTGKVDWKRHLPIFAGFTVYLLAGAVLQNGTLMISYTFRASDLITILFVGITEELVFRGWLLNATCFEGKKWHCIFINAVMFLAIHFPIWIRSGIFVSSFIDFGFVCILALSVIFSLAFLKSKSIWVPVFLHMYWDLLVFLLY